DPARGRARVRSAGGPRAARAVARVGARRGARRRDSRTRPALPGTVGRAARPARSPRGPARERLGVRPARFRPEDGRPRAAPARRAPGGRERALLPPGDARLARAGARHARLRARAGARGPARPRGARRLRNPATRGRFEMTRVLMAMTLGGL